MTHQRISLVLLAAGATVSAAALAHVPFLEQDDYTAEAPFVVLDVPNSKSLHASIDTPDDVDVFRIAIDEPMRIYTTTNIPFCAQYETYAVTYALTGPGLPQPEVDLPIELPDGHGAVVVRNVVNSVDERPVFFEPYGGRLMWEGPDYAIDDAPPGEYQMIVWNEDGELGNYIAVVGEAEIFGPEEIAQVRRVSPLLKRGQNLRVDCDPSADANGGAPVAAGAD